MSYYLWAPIVTIPFIAGLLGFKTNGRSFLIGTAAAALTIAFWGTLNIEVITGLSVLLPGLVANAVGFFGSHYLLRTHNFSQAQEAQYTLR
ncbi:MAG: hypothetical protein COC15_04200 [Legionellales bacterium]|nr:MAG: hypothetical protein COC15_04200 [Legionellales bacterium]